ncbi:hypothetical protein EV714DRAFT_278361 [Schizophyllum commune]
MELRALCPRARRLHPLQDENGLMMSKFASRVEPGTANSPVRELEHLSPFLSHHFPHARSLTVALAGIVIGCLQLPSHHHLATLAYRRALPLISADPATPNQPLTRALPTPRQRHVPDPQPPRPRARPSAASIPAPLKASPSPESPPLPLSQLRQRYPLACDA